MSAGVADNEELEAVSMDEAHGGASARVFVLGRTLSDFSPALASLDDFGEMVLSLVHPLVQVYSIPKTGELAYVGHTCNFRQNVKSFMTRLPMRPAEMPMLMVKPRPPAGKAVDTRPRNPFKVNTVQLRAAFEWLRRHNVQYAATVACAVHVQIVPHRRV